MNVNVNQSRNNDLPGNIDLLISFQIQLPDCLDFLIFNQDIRIDKTIILINLTVF